MVSKATTGQIQTMSNALATKLEEMAKDLREGEAYVISSYDDSNFRNRHLTTKFVRPKTKTSVEIVENLPRCLYPDEKDQVPY